MAHSARWLREFAHQRLAVGGAHPQALTTVWRDLSTAPHGAVPDRITGLDGKSRPAKRPTIVATKGEVEAEKAQRRLGSANDVGRVEPTRAPGRPSAPGERVEAVLKRLNSTGRSGRVARAAPLDAAAMASVAITIRSRGGDGVVLARAAAPPPPARPEPAPGALWGLALLWAVVGWALLAVAVLVIVSWAG